VGGEEGRAGSWRRAEEAGLFPKRQPVIVGCGEDERDGRAGRLEARLLRDQARRDLDDCAGLRLDRPVRRPVLFWDPLGVEVIAMGPFVHVQDLQGIDVLVAAGTLSKRRLAVPDHIEAERDALAQGISQGPSDPTSSTCRSCPAARDHVPRPDAQHPKAGRRTSGRVPLR
jgi:hypothetical protein